MNKSKIIITCIILTILIFTPIAAGLKEQSPILASNESDFDPLVDLTVTVDIQKIRSFDKYDWQVFRREYVDRQSDPDFYIKVFINNEEFTSPIWNNTKYIYDPEWNATLDVPDDEEFVDIKIQLWDLLDENSGTDKLCDISGDSGSDSDSYDVELQYSIKTGHWEGDDSINDDPSGYGRLNGCDDGSIYKHDRDCELSFNIYQNDYDNDGIPYWTEVNVYGTDPEIDNTGEDGDNDDVPIEWEWKYGYDPLTTDDHTHIDPDNDGITNVEEYLTSQWGSDPFIRDIFVELDRMEDGPGGEKIQFPEGSKELLYTAFNRQNVLFHIDDGYMGGGEIIPFDDKTYREELQDLYWNYFLHGDENNWRRGIFHYGVLIYSHESVAGAMFRPNSFYITSRGHERKAEKPFLDRDTVFASAYMHELGHTLGFWPIPGHSRNSMYPWQLGWWLARPYKSCMNYGYMYTTVDYSDGSRIIRDYDDWTRMDLTYFQRNW